jgi:hypothetical protein
MFNATGKLMRFTMPGNTVVVHRAYTSEDDLVLTMNLSRLRRAESQVGRDFEDPSVMRKAAEAERAAMATEIEAVENWHEDGDCVTDKEEIAAFLKALPLAWYTNLKEAMTSGLGLFEGKA